MNDRQKFIEEWDQMPDSEKLEIMNKRMEAFKQGRDCEKDFLTVEHIDNHCEEWMSKTPEEKALFVEDIKQKFKERHEMMKGHFSHPGFGFGFHGRR